MIKKILVIFLVIVSANVNAQSNRQRLDDIEDKLDNLILQQQLIEIERLRRQNEQIQMENNRPPQRYVYKNTDTVQENTENAAYFNLSYSEYVRRNEINHNRCINSSIFQQCYFAGMIGISLTELDKRFEKTIKRCPIGNATDKEIKTMKECQRKIIILGK